VELLAVRIRCGFDRGDEQLQLTHGEAQRAAVDQRRVLLGRTSNLPVLSDALPTAIGAENAAGRARTGYAAVKLL